METTELFSGKAEIYAKSRPSYPAAFFDYLFARLPLGPETRVADMGAGTGIFSQLLLEQGLRVTAVEPNDDMRARAEIALKEYAGFSVVKGTAEASGLSMESQDLVTAAQAFHWFDTERFRTECRRILKKNGHVVLVWNNRDFTSSLVQENAEVCRRFCPAFKGFSGGLEEGSEGIELFFGKGGYEIQSFENNLMFDCEGFIRRNLSSSYAPLEGTEEYEGFIKALKDLFDKYKTDGMVLIPNAVRSYLGRV